MIKKMSLKQFGLLHDNEFRFADLNVLVGPQATGKSLTLQMIKLLEDKKYITQQFEQYNYKWSKLDEFAELYFGEGMHGFIDKTIVEADGKMIDLKLELKYRRGFAKGQKIKCFYVPAQRVLIIEDGWPKAFESFENSFPYVSREYSNILRDTLNRYRLSSIFPAQNRLKSYMRNDIENTIYHNASVAQTTDRGKKRIQLRIINTSYELPMTLISAGQREFLPYLISLYYLLPAGRVKSVAGLESVIIEEPEMGLHPQGIRTFFLSILELLNRGYRVYVSTHSVDLMNYIWAFRSIQVEKKKEQKVKAMEQLMGLKCGIVGKDMVETLINKKTTVHFFDLQKDSVIVRDISDLDLDETNNISPWGGFLQSASISADVISSL
jgi:predicted ATP-dependent endonuclease of OLD family